MALRPWEMVALLLLLASLPVQLYIQDRHSAKDVHTQGRDLLHGGRGWLAAAHTAWLKLGLLAPAAAHRLLQQALSPSPASTPAATRPDTAAEDTDPVGHFAGGAARRLSREGVYFRIGQVVSHKRLGYRGVIVGWDQTAKAPEQWLEQRGYSAEQRQQAFFAILVDNLDAKQIPAPMEYVWQGDLVLSTGRVTNPHLDRYFTGYNTGMRMYAPKDVLRLRYPKD